MKRPLPLALLACLCGLLCSGVSAAEDDEIDLITGRAVGPAKLPAGAKAFSGAVEEMGKLALSRDGKFAAGAGKDGKVRIFDAATAKLHTTFEAEKDDVGGISFAPDGKSVFTCGGSGFVKQWDVESGKELRKLEGHTGAVGSVLVSPDGQRLASTDSTGIHIWDLKTGKPLCLLVGHEVPKELSSPIPLAITALAFSADGRILLTEANDETAMLWDAANGKALRTLPNHDGSEAAVALSPDGALGISTRGNRQQWSERGEAEDNQPVGGRLRVWEVATGKVRRVLIGHRADLTCLAFSHDGRYIFSGSHDRTVRQWEVDSGVELRRVKLVSSPLGVASAPDGKTAMTISQAEGLVVWDLTAAPRPFGGNVAVSDMDDAWKKLASISYDERSAAFAFYLTRPPAEVVADLSRRMKETKPAKTPAEFQKLIDQLDDANYQLRLNAFEELTQQGADAREALSAALSHASVEVRVRATALLSAIGGASDPRSVLVIELLAALKTPEAKSELTRLASAALPCSAHAKAKLK